VKVFPVRPVPEAAPLPPGALRDGLVGTATHPVRLGDVQPEGKRRMPAADWLRGLRVTEGTFG
jgi:methionyl-tRNA formyltransferase